MRVVLAKDINIDDQVLFAELVAIVEISVVAIGVADVLDAEIVLSESVIERAVVLLTD